MLLFLLHSSEVKNYIVTGLDSNFLHYCTLLEGDIFFVEKENTISAENFLNHHINYYPLILFMLIGNIVKASNFLALYS